MPNDLRLKVIVSTIDGKGVAKLDADSYRALRLDEGTTVTVTYGTKSCELIARQDSIFSEASIRLMKHDMDSLLVAEGMLAIVAKKSAVKSEPDSLPRVHKGRKPKKVRAASLDKF